MFVLACTYGSIQAVRQIIYADPFVKLRGNTKEQAPSAIAITMEKVNYRHYNGSTLVATALVDKLEMTKDRTQAMLVGIRDGKYYAKNGKFIQFEASGGNWSQTSGQFNVSKDVHVYNKDFNLRSTALNYDSRKSLVNISQKVAGKFFDGMIETASLSYHVPSGSYKFGETTWKGNLETQENGEKTKKKTRWTIKGKGGSKGAGDTETYLFAQATDGEIIVMADRIERNVKTDVIQCLGNVKYFGSEANLVCDKATIYRKEKRALMEENISMLVKAKDQQGLKVETIEPLRPIVPDSISAGRPKNEDKEQDKEVHDSQNRRKYPVKVYCQRIEYWYAKGSRRANISGAPQAHQDLPKGRWRAIWCSDAAYDAENETLRMNSATGRPVRVKTSLGDDLTANWFRISTRDNDDSWEAEGIEGDVVPEDEDENVPPEQPPARTEPKTPTQKNPLKGNIGGSKQPKKPKI